MATQDTIAQLAIGETYAKCEQIPFENCNRIRIMEVALAARNILNKTARRATDETGHVYRVETGEITLRDGVMVMVAVTRAE